MPHRLSVASWLALTLLLTACASGPTIIANQDPAADFRAYRTFDFMSPLSTDQAVGLGIVSGFLIRSTEEELEARGLKRSANNPDLLIDFVISSKTKISGSTGPTTSAAVHGGRGGYGTWGGYSMSMGTPTVTTQTQGTLAVDLVDASRGQLVWEGAATKRVTDSTRRNLEEVLHTRTALANKMSWADDWTDAPLSPGRRLKPKEDSGIVSDAKPLLNGDTPRKAQKLAATEARRRKKKRRKRDKNPFVEALKESEGGKGGSAKEYEDLEDFIVCKPGRDYRRLLGL